MSAAPMFTKPRSGKLSPSRKVPQTQASIWRGSTRDVKAAADEILNRRGLRPQPRA